MSRRPVPGAQADWRRPTHASEGMNQGGRAFPRSRSTGAEADRRRPTHANAKNETREAQSRFMFDGHTAEFFATFYYYLFD